VEYGLAILMGYVCGAVPVAALVARRYGVDLHATGDGNPGAWNALEQLGARRAWAAFVGDGAKALVPTLAAHLAWGFWPAWAAAAGAMLGHAFPLPDPRRGGKGVMCFVGAAVALSPLAAAACAVLAAAVAALRGFAWGARAAVFAFPVAQLLTDPIGHVAGTGALMCLIGALFFLRRRSAVPASSGPGAAPTP
jgi:acyl phosphate:glycerol-3-phosphate acyltransferase